MVQTHTLAPLPLRRSVKRHDRLAVSKVVTQLMRAPPRSPLATILLVRYALSLLAADATSINMAALSEFLDACASHRGGAVCVCEPCAPHADDTH